MKKMIRSALGLVTLSLGLSLAGPGALADVKQSPWPTNEKGSLYVYAVGLDGALWHVKKTNGAWGGWQRWGGKIAGSPDACSPNPGKILVMLRAADNTLGQIAIDAGKGRAWTTMNSKVGSDPGLACAPGDRTSLFVRAHNNAELYATGAENGSWATMFSISEQKAKPGLAIEDVQKAANAPVKKSFWDNFNPAGDPFYTSSFILGASGLGGQIKGGPEGVIFGSPGSPRQAVFVRGMDDTIWWRVTDAGNTKWLPFESLGGLKMTSDPTAVPWKNGGLLLFARGADNGLWVREYRNGQTWTAWFPWGGTLAGSPDATSWGGNRVDVFVRGAKGEVLHFWREDDDVLIKTPALEVVPGGVITGDPTAVGAKW